MCAFAPARWTISNNSSSNSSGSTNTKLQSQYIAQRTIIEAIPSPSRILKKHQARLSLIRYNTSEANHINPHKTSPIDNLLQDQNQRHQIKDTQSFTELTHLLESQTSNTTKSNQEQKENQNGNPLPLHPRTHHPVLLPIFPIPSPLSALLPTSPQIRRNRPIRPTPPINHHIKPTLNITNIFNSPLPQHPPPKTRPLTLARLDPTKKTTRMESSHRDEVESTHEEGSR